MSFDDPLLSSCCGVEFAAYLDEPVVDLIEPFGYARETVVHLSAQISHVFAERVGAGHRGVSEVAQLTTECGDVAVGGAGKHTRGGRILLARTYSLGEVAHLCFQSGDACLKAFRVHEEQPNARRRHALCHQFMHNSGYP